MVNDLDVQYDVYDSGTVSDYPPSKCNRSMETRPDISIYESEDD